MDPFIGEIRTFAGTYAPADWAFCNGQTLMITQNTPLFAILGNIYGGNGTTTFCLPNLQGRVPLHVGQAPGASSYSVGQIGGYPTVTLQPDELAAHGHGLNASDAPGSHGPSPTAVLAQPVTGSLQARTVGAMYAAVTPNVSMTTPALGTVGGGQPHNNMMPYLAINYIIALRGMFPQRS